MKESIYTIPINEAFSSECHCPLCSIYEKLEDDLVEASVGAAMMEPDRRIETNEKGFCKKHIEQMSLKKQVLPLSLVLQTHIRQQIDTIFNMQSKPRMFSKGKKETAQKISQYIDGVKSSCYICNTLEAQMQRYAENIVYMWKKDEQFKSKFSEKSFCVNHLKLLLDIAVKDLGENHFNTFFDILLKNAKASYEKSYNDITDFVNSFDYRFKGELSQDTKTATRTVIDKFIY
ncbi:MAG: hypothetical protein J6V58_05390 [Clostridia bacterium]|nr:hypothetical protein [Clostridia bacterium]